MQDKKLSSLIRASIILIAVCGMAICLLWVPMGEFGWKMGDVWLLDGQVKEFWAQIVFHWIVSLPCFYLLWLAWQVTGDMKKGRLFIFENASRVKYATWILAGDLLLFLLGHTLFALLRWNTCYMVYLLVALIGLIVTVFLGVVSHYLSRAAELQEESDATI